MADLQKRLEDLQAQVDTIARQANAGDDVSAQVNDLERQARELLSDAKNTPQESIAQEIFAEIARLTSPTSPASAEIRGYLRRARIRIEIAGDDEDIDEAIDILAEAIAVNPNHDETVQLLQAAASHNPQARQRVSDLFMRHGVDHPAVPVVEEPTPTPSDGMDYIDDGDFDEDTGPTYSTSAGYPPPEQNIYPRRTGETGKVSTQSTPRVPGQGPLYTGVDIDEMMSDLTQAYYAGDYQQTIEIANRILSNQPGNPTSLEYREKAEDSLIRGVVPDHRIPFDARVSYNRANSLVRAGNYDEAERLYREAIDLAERTGILNWKDAQQALLDIQDLSLARGMLNEGDRLMAVDNWQEALRKYEGALRVVPNDPQAEDRLETVRRVQSEADQAAVQLSTISGSLSDQVAQLHNIQAILTRAMQLLPNSQRLAGLQSDTNNKLATIKTQINDQAQSALSRAHNAMSVDERLMLANEATRLLELGVELDSSDTRVSDLTMEARGMSADLQRAKQVIERAGALIAQNFDAELSQARTMLAGLQQYAQDERYRIVVDDLLSRYLERAEIALEDGDTNEAQTWLSTMKEEPFNILGRRSEVQRLENQIRRDKRRSRQQLGGIIGGIIIVLIIGALLTRPQWESTLFPGPTETATPTFTPSITFTPTQTATPTASPTITLTSTVTITPSLTITPSHTPTHTNTPTHTHTPTSTSTSTSTPTSTPTSTATLTPTITQTPLALCIVTPVDPGGARVRSTRSTTGNTQVGTLPSDEFAEVYDQQYGDRGFVWYQIRVQVGDANLSGWVRSDSVEFFGAPCAELPAQSGN